MGNVTVRIEEMVCQNLRGWQEEIGEESRGGGRKSHRHTEVENYSSANESKAFEIFLGKDSLNYRKIVNKTAEILVNLC